MIIGGLLGGTVSGKDRGAAAGAVIGGLMAADQGQQTKRVIVGYRSEQQCNLVQVNTEQSHIKNYRITYEWNGIRGTIQYSCQKTPHKIYKLCNTPLYQQ